jgi:hypothetical protein
MTPLSATANLIACPHCGHHDSGTYCSACGKELSTEHKPVLAEAWEHVVLDRVTDLRAYLTTTAWLIVRPHRFFRTAMEGPARRAGHVFPQPVAPALPRGVVQRPVKYLILSFVASLIASKLTNADVAAWIPGADDDVNNELSLLFLLAYIVLYGVVFHRSSGRRVSAEEASVFNGYLAGTNMLIAAAAALTPATWEPLLVVEALLLGYVAIIIPHRVLPRLYPITRVRVLLAQAGAATGAFVILFLALAVVYVVTGAVRGLMV